MDELTDKEKEAGTIFLRYAIKHTTGDQWKELNNNIQSLLCSNERLKDQRNEFLGRSGLCGELTSLLKKYKGSVINGYVIFPDNTWFYHTWFKCHDNIIIDLSASQFNLKGIHMPNIYVGEAPYNYTEQRPKGKMHCFTEDQYLSYYLYKNIY